MRPSICVAAAFILSVSSLPTVAQTSGIKGQGAPSLTVDKWIQLPGTVTAKSRKSVDIKDYRGKVVLMFFFQSGCSGCREFGFPTMKKMKARYNGDKGVAFVAIQTVNEGHSVNTPQRGLDMARKFELDGIAVGHSDSRGEKSVFKAYKPGGTPWMVVVDKRGIVQYNDFFLDPPNAVQLIDSLKAQ